MEFVVENYADMEKNGCNPIKNFLLYVSRWKSELDDKTFLIANITFHQRRE